MHVYIRVPCTREPSGSGGLSEFKPSTEERVSNVGGSIEPVTVLKDLFVTGSS